MPDREPQKGDHATIVETLLRLAPGGDDRRKRADELLASLRQGGTSARRIRGRSGVLQRHPPVAFTWGRTAATTSRALSRAMTASASR